MKRNGLCVAVMAAILATTGAGCFAPSEIPASFNAGAPVGTGFLARTLPNGRKYAIYIPPTYSAGKPTPTILFLHGLGEGGSRGTGPLTVGLANAIRKDPARWPFIVVFPQSKGDWAADRSEMKDAIDALNATGRELSVDQSRIYLTGLSTGGYGVWALAQKYPTRFAALVPMCGYSKTDAVPAIKGLPIWVFHNSGDPFVNAGNSDSMVDKLKAAGADVKYSKYGAFGHDCWPRAYAEPELPKWLLSHTNRGAIPAVSMW